MPIQQMLLGGGAAVATKTYVDDVFSTYVYKGNGSTQTLNTGVDLTEGGLIWLKCRNQSSQGQYLMDSARNSFGNRISSSDNTAQTTDALITATSSTGFTLGSKPYSNNSGDTYASWSFRKAPGFFDVVTWSGDSATSRTISHNLGCIPGMIVIKKTVGTTSDWVVYHRSVGNTKALYLNATNYAYTGTYWFNDTSPTADEFTIGNIHLVNGSGNTYVAYLFAGGESTAATARSVDFDGTSDFLSVGSTSDFQFGTGDYTVEAWLKPEDLNTRVWLSFGMNNPSFKIISGKWEVYNPAVGSSVYSGVPVVDQWTHYAIARSSGTTKIFINGIETNSFSDTLDVPTQGATIGAYSDDTYEWKGGISNVRVVKGTAVYTSSFRPPTEPLTNITNTKLLCCNNSSTTGSTVTPGTITANGDPTASTDSPFDDPAGFTFGDAGDQNVIKCGSYIGNGSSTGPEINLGWEPQFLILKESSDSGQQWRMYDSMRGIVTGGNDAELYPSSNTSEDPDNEFLELTSTGFKLKTTDDAVNDDGQTYIFLAIRRPDGYCGKLPELGTGVFAMDTGNSSSTIPTFDSGFPVDFAFYRSPASTENWYAGGRLLGNKYLKLDSDGAEATDANDQIWDSNEGWAKSHASSNQSWMFKRHAGFDVVTYTGNDVSGHQIPHSLNKTVEMMWVKFRNDTYDWQVYHKGLNGGTNPQNYKVQLNDTSVESGNVAWWNNTAPTSTSFTVGNSTRVNYDGGQYIAMLFASVDGISKVGSYTGNGNTGQTITLGFQPRFLIMKNIDTAADWEVLDTTRGWGSGNDNHIPLNRVGAQSADDMGAPTSTGFTLANNYTSNNKDGNKFIYYAHA